MEKFIHENRDILIVGLIIVIIAELALVTMQQIKQTKLLHSIDSRT